MGVPRRAAGAAALGDRVVVVGGIDAAGAATGAVEAYDAVADRWTPLAPLPRPLASVAVASHAGGLLAAGGFAADGAAVADVFAYDPAADAWTARAPLPAPRGGAGAAAFAGLVWVVGGRRGGAAIADFAAWNPATDAWRPGPPLPHARHALGVAATGLLLYAVGGRDATVLGLAEAFDAASGQWFKEVAPLGTPRAGPALVALGGRLFAFGGEAGAPAPALVAGSESFDPPRNSWFPEPAMPTPRREAAAAAVGARVCVVGGAAADGAASGATEIFLPPAHGVLAVRRLAVLRRARRVRLVARLPDDGTDPGAAPVRVSVRDARGDVLALRLGTGALAAGRRRMRWRPAAGTLPPGTRLRLARRDGLRLRLAAPTLRAPAPGDALAVGVEIGAGRFGAEVTRAGR